MMISSKNKILGAYKSFLKDYLIDQYKYDGSQLIYFEKDGLSSFSITKPNSNYKNCNFVNGYPHFQISKDVCLAEIYNFLNDKPIYDDNFTIRYGDLHPNKPIPMLGQLRNIIIDKALVNIIKTSGKKNNIFTVGNISEKSIKHFVNSQTNTNNEALFNLIYSSVFHYDNQDNKNVLAYLSFCYESLNIIENYFKQLLLSDNSYLLESQLYADQELYNIVKKLTYEDAFKSNGEIKYVLQEFMFILNNQYKNSKIINIIGSNQSEHIKKVLDVVHINNLNCDVSYLTYSLCKNADSRNIEEWSRNLFSLVKDNDIKVDSQFINARDLIKFIIIANSNDTIIDFENPEYFKINFWGEIYKGLQNAKRIARNGTIYNCKLLSNMALVNQVIDKAVTFGDISKLLRYLYSVSHEFNNNLNEYQPLGELYYEFTAKCLNSLNVSDTKLFQKVL